VKTREQKTAAQAAVGLLQKRTPAYFFLETGVRAFLRFK